MSARTPPHWLHSALRCRGAVVAVDKGFAAKEGLDVELVREVSWSNVRDKLNIGLFDAAHLLAPVAIASSLGLGHVKVPIIAPFNLGLNGNAITVSPELHAALKAAADGDIADPMVSARALARVVVERKREDEEPVTFGMTFPYSTHNYHLRFWMAAGGVDPDEDVRLVVLPPPYMVESLANKHVDGFCVGAPWNSVAVDLGIGYILHFVSDILASRGREGAGGAQHLGGGQSGYVGGAGARAWPRRELRRGCGQPRRGLRATCGAEPYRRHRRGHPPHARRPAEGRAGRNSADRAIAICSSAAPAPRGPIRCTRPGSTPRWCAGDKPSSLRSISRPRKPRSGPISTT